MNINNIDEVRSLLNKLREANEAHDAISASTYIHVEFRAPSHRNATHLHCDVKQSLAGLLDDEPDFNIIYPAVKSAIQHQIASIVAKLAALGVKIDG